MARIAILSLHTSPLAQPGTGDGGGMNVYVRELSGALAHAGVECDVYTRAWAPDLAPVVNVEPGVRVHHVPAGPRASVAKEELAELVPEFTAGVLERIEREGRPALFHANYWLSGVAGHTLKHELELPLVSTFHTLARTPGHGSVGDSDRAKAEADIIGCSDAILASSVNERGLLQRLYEAVPSRVEIVPPGVDHEVFSPGDRAQARAALQLGAGPVLLFVGRIQPLKGVDIAVQALSHLPAEAQLVVVGGPSGRDGDSELRRLHDMVDAAGLDTRVRFVAPQPHDGLTTYYRAADVCLVPSRSESFGLVALEAAACGTPVVAAAVGGLTSLVDDGRTGYLVSGRDPADFARPIAGLLADPEAAAEMGMAAARRARQYSWSITAARLRRLYGDLAARQLVECR